MAGRLGPAPTQQSSHLSSLVCYNCTRVGARQQAWSTLKAVHVPHQSNIAACDGLTKLLVTVGDSIGVGTEVQLSSNCTGAAADFALSSQGVLRHQYSGLCVGPNPAAPSTTPPPPPPQGSGAIESAAIGECQLWHTYLAYPLPRA